MLQIVGLDTSTQWITDIILPILSIVIILGLYFWRKCDLAILLAWCVGFFLGAIWEFGFFTLARVTTFTVHGGCHTIDGTEICLPDNPLPDWYITLAHTIEDAGIFMIGVGLAWLLLGRNKRPRFTHWHWGEFGIIWAWGVISNYIVDWTSTGTTFLFIPTWFNPAYYSTSLFSKEDLTIPYTILPDATWALVTIPFYAILLWLKRRYGGQYFRQGNPTEGLRQEN
jgi:hypothetical protein